MVKLKNHRRKKIKKKSHKFNLNLDYLIKNEIKHNSIRQKFCKDCLKLANSVSKKKILDHEDLTHIPFVTIDGKDSKDFDDAVWSKKKKNKIEIMIAISDVSFYVNSGDLLDLEARKRGNSFYFPNSVVPMLPHELSSNICSLVPNKKRACVIVHSEIDLLGNILSFNFKRGIIKSVANLNYEEVEDFIVLKKISKNLKGKTSLIDNLKSAFKILNARSKARGKLNLDIEEYEIVIEEKNNFNFKKKRNSLSNKIIEELMIHANNIVANFFIKKNMQGIYRNHEVPSDEKIDKLKELFNQIEVSFEKKKIKSQKYLSSLIDETEESNRRKIKENILKIQSKAYYHKKNKGHFGLALENYTHFTSPIRRYSDLIAHRLIINLITNKNKKSENNVFNNDSLHLHLTNQEKKSDIIERNILEKSCCLYLQKLKRKKFVGYIDGFIEYGIFIKSADLPFSGLLKFNTLKDDFYLYNQDQLCAEGRKKGNRFKLNDKVMFSIRSIDSVKGKVSLEKMKIINE